jgi:hypothetical protein
MGRKETASPLPNRQAESAKLQPGQPVPLAPFSPLLIDPEWLEHFQSLLRRFVAAGSDVSRYHHLPGYPVWIGFRDVRNTFLWLRQHIHRVLRNAQERLMGEWEGLSTAGLEKKIWIAYQWAYAFIEDPILKARLLEISYTDFASIVRDIESWLPTDAELDACRAILDYLSHFDFEASGDGAAGGSDTPRRDAGRYRLSIDGNQAHFNDRIYVLGDGEAAFLQELVNAGPGHWVSGPKMGPMVQPRPDRVFDRLKRRLEWVGAIVESEAGKGFRLKPDVATSTYAKLRP